MMLGALRYGIVNWNQASRSIQPIDEATFCSIAFDPNGQLLAAVGWDSKV